MCVCVCVCVGVAVFATLSFTVADEEEKTVVQKCPTQKVIRLSSTLSLFTGTESHVSPYKGKKRAAFLQYYRLFSQSDKSWWQQIGTFFLYLNWFPGMVDIITLCLHPQRFSSVSSLLKMSQSVDSDTRNTENPTGSTLMAYFKMVFVLNTILKSQYVN